MAVKHQISSVDTDKLILGNYAMSTAPTSGATFVDLGPGMLTAWDHQFTNSNVQSGNSVDPLEWISEETLTWTFDLIEYHASVISALMGGLTNTSGITSTSSTLRAGGATQLTKRAFKMTNHQIIDDSTVETVITVFQAVVDSGFSIQVKSDNDADPINVFQFAMHGENDESQSVGSQLFTILKDETS